MISGQEHRRFPGGLDVGKTGRHVVTLKRSAKKIYATALPQDQPKSGILTKLASYGRVLVGVDQPATIGALPVPVP